MGNVKICKWEGCNTILRSGNITRYCSVHYIQHLDKMQEKRRKSKVAYYTQKYREAHGLKEKKTAEAVVD